MAKKNVKLNIVCFSNQLWDFRNWTNKKHVMYRLGQEGHNVIFVDPPINVGNVFFKYVNDGFWGIWRILTRTKKTETGVCVLSPLNIIPFTKVTAFLHAIKIKLLMRLKFDKEQKTLLWIYNVEIPHIDTYLKILDRDLLIYDCVDNYEAFPRYDSPEKKKVIREIEVSLTEEADLVFATAPGLVDKLKPHNPNVYYTPNVGDYNRFKDAKKRKYNLPADIASIPKPIIGFVGALDQYKFDAKLMSKVVSDHPDKSFVFIGQMALKDRKATLKDIGLGQDNVYFLGSKPFDDIPNYYAGFDVCVIPYVLNDYTVGGCFPVKFHEALAVGLPTLVTDLPAYAPFKDVSYIAKTPNEFSVLIQEALNEDNAEKFRARQNVAKENSWDNKVKNMLSLINDALQKK